MKKIFGLVFFILFSSNSFAITYQIDPQTIQLQAEKSGWKTVLNTIFNDQTAANMVLLAIDSGSEDWLNLALIMLKKTDNARTQKMLIMSLGEALQWQPSNVLSIVTKQVPVENLCSIEGVYEWRLMSRFLAVQAINRRIGSLNKLSDFKLAKLKQDCIAELNKSKKMVLKELSNFL